MTTQERKDHAAKLARAWYATPAGQAYQLIRRERLFAPDWQIQPGPRKWTFREDVQIMRRTKSDRQLAIKFKVTTPAVRQRRVRLNRLLLTAGLHTTIANGQIAYSIRLQNALSS